MVAEAARDRHRRRRSDRRPGFFGRLFGIKSEVQKYLDKYEDVRCQIDGITTELEQHKTKMLTDIVKLDKLYDANLDYFRTLEVYIAAGRAKLKELDEQLIPALSKQVEAAEDVLKRRSSATFAPPATISSGACTTCC